MLVERMGIPVAALVSTNDLDRLVRFDQDRADPEEAEDWAVIDRLRARNADKDPDRVMADVTEAVEEIRREMHEQEQRAAARL